MAGTQDWFYHAPSKKNVEGPKDYPAASQIPSLGGGLPYEEWEKGERDENGMKRGWIRDSDSKYIQLCKKGGRKDLLQMRSKKPIDEAPKDYPRADWFYGDSVEEESAKNTTPHKPQLPDYMVYEEYHPDEEGDGNTVSWKRPPYSLDDKMTAFERHGDAVTDKMNLKIPNDPSKLRKPPKFKNDGKDFRRKKQEDKNRRSAEKSRHAKIPTPESYRDKVSFGKLLSNGYQADWYQNRDTHFKSHKMSDKDALFEAATRGDRQSTEYREAISKHIPKGLAAAQSGPNSYSKEVRGTKKSEQLKAISHKKEEEKELFKISKFDKVGSKINSRWSETHERSSPVLDVLAGQQMAVADVQG